jgi:hypothetical protein
MAYSRYTLVDCSPAVLFTPSAPGPLQEVLDWFEEKSLRAYSISAGQSLLYNDIFPKHKERLGKKMSELVVRIRPAEGLKGVGGKEQQQQHHVQLQAAWWMSELVVRGPAGAEGWGGGQQQQGQHDVQLWGGGWGRSSSSSRQHPVQLQAAWGNIYVCGCCCPVRVWLSAHLLWGQPITGDQEWWPSKFISQCIAVC